MALTSLNKRTYDLRGSRIYMHTESMRSRMLEGNVGTDVEKSVLGAVDVGQHAYWWDYGQLKLYLKNTLLLNKDSAEAAQMRRFLGVCNFATSSNVLCSDSTAKVDQASCLSGKCTEHSFLIGRSAPN